MAISSVGTDVSADTLAASEENALEVGEASIEYMDAQTDMAIDDLGSQSAQTAGMQAVERGEALSY